MKHALHLTALAALFALSAAAHAAGPLAAGGGIASPDTGNTSDPSNWRIAPGQVFNGVAGALDGVAKLTIVTSDGGTYGCSGSLLQGGQYVLTAAHCADDFTSMRVDFGWYNGTATLGTRTVAVGQAFVHPGWDGTLDTGADIAVLKLSAPVTNIAGYKLSTTNDVGKKFLIGGFGTTGVASDGTDTTWGDSRYGHWGYNSFDVTSQAFNAGIGNRRIGSDNWVYNPADFRFGATYMSDFDHPTPSLNAAYNSLGRIASAYGGNAWTSDGGWGAQEALIAGGDSGGGDFIFEGGQWILSGVHSWGWDDACGYFTLTGCNGRRGNSASYGDLSGSTATFSHIDWINGVVGVSAVPEPQSIALMLAGLGLLGGAARRRRG